MITSLFKSYRALIVLPAVFAAIACDGGKSSSSKPAETASSSVPSPYEDKKSAAEALKKIAEDKSLTDEQAIKAYIKRYPYGPMAMPQGQKAWAVVLPMEGGGFNIFVKRFDPTFTDRGADKFDPLQAERDGLKRAAEFCHLFLTDLAPRGLKGISFTYLSSVTNDAGGQAQYADMFRALVTPADLPKITPVKDLPATAGSVFDPRAESHKSIWAVEINLYPQIEYRKKAS